MAEKTGETRLINRITQMYKHYRINVKIYQETQDMVTPKNPFNLNHPLW